MTVAVAMAGKSERCVICEESGYRKRKPCAHCDLPFCYLHMKTHLCMPRNKDDETAPALLDS